MANPNQTPNQQNAAPHNEKSQPAMVKCRVVSGVFLKARGSDEDDVYAKVGEIVEVPRKYYEKHIKGRLFDSYQSSSGGIDPFPHSHNDATLELVEDAKVA